MVQPWCALDVPAAVQNDVAASAGSRRSRTPKASATRTAVSTRPGAPPSRASTVVGLTPAAANNAASHRNARYADKVNDTLVGWIEYARKLEARIAEADLALLVKTAHAEGLTAFLDAFKAANPDSPVLRDSGKRYKKSGNVKTVGRIRYEAAHDAFLIGKGIADPTRHRVD